MSLRSRKPVARSTAQGFSLLELMVTVAILSIIVAIAVPSFANLTRRNRLTSAANEMVSLMQAARNAAVSNRASATVCPSANGTACTGVVGNRWIALTTKRGVNTVVREANMAATVTVKASANLSGGGNKFTFSPNGFSSAGAASSGTLRVCSPELSGDNAVDVSASVGRISTRRAPGTSACAAPADN